MFELRILRKRTDKVQPSGEYYIDVLQFKIPGIQISADGSVKHVYDEWKDVPIVEE